MLCLRAEDNTRYADWIEHTLYNALLPGLSLDGQAYFYQSPLENDGSHRRQPWFGCACCPPNIARVLAQLPGYFYSVTNRRFPESDERHDTVWVHLFAEGEAVVPLHAGGSVTLRQHTRYPWDGEVTVEIADLHEAGDFTLQLRVPSWAAGASVAVNGEALPPSEAAGGQYATMRRVWRVGDKVTLKLPMPVRRMVSHPRVAANHDRVALMRGPMLYAIEAADNPAGDVRDYVVPDDAQIVAAYRPDLLGGVVVLTASGERSAIDASWNAALYQVLGAEGSSGHSGDLTMTAIPYHVWANRGAGPMSVWIRRK